MTLCSPTASLKLKPVDLSRPCTQRALQKLTGPHGPHGGLPYPNTWLWWPGALASLGRTGLKQLNSSWQAITTRHCTDSRLKYLPSLPVKKIYLLVWELQPKGQALGLGRIRRLQRCSQGMLARESHLCTFPRTWYNLAIPLRKELIHLSRDPVFANVKHLQISWTGGQQGLQLWSHRPACIFIH